MSHATNPERASTPDSSSQATTNRSDKVAMYWTIGLWIGLAAVSVLAIAGIYFQSTDDDSSTAATPPAATATTVQPVAAKSIQPPVAASAVLEPIELTSASKAEAPVSNARSIGIISIDALEKKLDDYYARDKELAVEKWHVTPCWTSDSPFLEWGEMGTRAADEEGIERPAD